MPATTVKSARKNLKSLVRDVTSDTVAVEIVGEQDNAVLISLARYTALREATFLLRSPELMESLRREAARSLMPPAPGDDFVDTVVHDTITGKDSRTRPERERLSFCRRMTPARLAGGPTLCRWKMRWARRVSNPRPLVCKTRALPLSYTPRSPAENFRRSRLRTLARRALWPKRPGHEALRAGFPRQNARFPSCR